MPRPLRSLGGTTLTLLLAVLAGGCQSGNPLKPAVDDIAPQMKKRRAEVTAEFDAQRDEAQFLVAQNAWQQGNYSGCLDSLDSLLKRNPHHAQGLALLHKLEEQGAAQTPSQIKLAGHTAPLNAGQGTNPPKPREANTPREIAQTEAGASQRDAEYVGGARDDVARHCVQQAIEALARGDAKRAGAFYRAAISAEKDNVQIPIAAAVLALRCDQKELSLEMARQAASAYPENPDAYRVLGTVYYRRGEYELARSALERSIALDKSHPLSYFLMGSTLAKLGQGKMADWNFQQARRLDPKYTVTR